MDPTLLPDPMVGRVLDGRYRIEALLGQGGVGAVYRADHLKLERPVAVKILHKELLSVQDLSRRFEREARVLASMSHPHIVTVMDYGVSDDMPYLVMELLEGRTLRDAMTGLMKPETAMRITVQILKALAYAHGQGLVHRDLKPDNVFLQAIPNAEEHVRILDFGLAKFMEGDEESGGPALTRAGQIFGTPGYMAPEQASAMPTDARTDVYAMGILLFEMLAGRRPFEGQSAEVLRQHLMAPVPPLQEVCPERKPEPALTRLLERALAKDPNARFDSAREMLDALSEVPRPVVTRNTNAGAGHTVEQPIPTEVLRASAASRARASEPGGGASEPKGVEARGTQIEIGRRRDVGDPARSLIMAGLIGAGVVLLVVMLIVVAGAIFGDDDEEETTAGGTHGEETVLEPPEPTRNDRDEQEWIDESEPVVEPSPTPTEQVRVNPVPSGANPWAGELPSTLARARSSLSRGRRASEGALRNYARVHPDDGRPWILIGRLYLLRGWRPDALESFQKGFERDRNLRNDPQTVLDMLELVKHSRTHGAAARVMASVWGAEARPYVEQDLQRVEDSQERARLQRLLGML